MYSLYLTQKIFGKLFGLKINEENLRFSRAWRYILRRIHNSLRMFFLFISLIFVEGKDTVEVSQKISEIQDAGKRWKYDLIPDR